MGRLLFYSASCECRMDHPTASVLEEFGKALGGSGHWKQQPKNKNNRRTVANDDNGVVHVLSNVRYGSVHPRQALDVYFPQAALLLNNNDSKHSKSFPVLIHIHGGGWSRGSKDNGFYGAPAVCTTAARCAGWIAVSVGYRLGTYPDFMYDAAAAIQWVMQKIGNVGGDLSNVVLSGHSAGAHIASLLLLRHSCFLAPRHVPVDFFTACILLSGVYDLFCPLRKAAVLDAKNKWFVLAYVLPAFGSDETVRREASPLLLLQPDIKDTSVLGRAAMSIRDRLVVKNSSSFVLRISVIRLSRSTTSSSNKNINRHLTSTRQNYHPKC